VDPSHWDKNFAAIFPIWDRMFGTLHEPPKRESYRLGLSDGSGDQYATISACYLEPFRKIRHGIRERGLRDMLTLAAAPLHAQRRESGSVLAPEAGIAAD
jgi:hypothetical protein